MEYYLRKKLEMEINEGNLPGIKWFGEKKS
jgi:hypothetical protein